MTSEQKRALVSDFLLEFLKDEYVRLTYEDLHVMETAGLTKVKLTLCHNKEHSVLESEGEDFVEACLSLLAGFLGPSYTTLENLKFEIYKIQIRPLIDAGVSVEIEVKTHRRLTLYFLSKGRSLIKSLMTCIFDIFEFFINAESAFVKLRKLDKEALQRQRPDLSQKYKIAMAQLVEVNNYEKVCV